MNQAPNPARPPRPSETNRSAGTNGAYFGRPAPRGRPRVRCSGGGGGRPVRRRSSPVFCDRPVQLFVSATDAWLWYVRCQDARNEGALAAGDDPDFARPCDIDDIYRIVKALHLAGRLRRDHMIVMFHYGERQARPDKRIATQVAHLALWDEAMIPLAEVLVSKGLLAVSKPLAGGAEP